MMRTHNCGELRMEHVGQEVTLCGWVQTSREMGPFTFVVLRDRYGLSQIAVYKSNPNFELAQSLGREFVVKVTGKVQERESKNPKMPTGDIEIIPDTMEVLNASDVPPIMIEDDPGASEETRMEYRYLDLRRKNMARNMMIRSKTTKAMRDFLEGEDFLEIETPVFIKSTPEGARDFIVPSRLQPGNFYALPQSPQILKQLLMVAGMDRYFQIVKCFRDEDFRGDRQPEFTQLDCEMSFVTQEDIWEMFGKMVRHVFKRVLDVDLPPIIKMKYADAIAKYGSDKPDLRFGAEIVELNEQFQGTDFVVFDNVLKSGGLIAGINAKGCAGYSRKQLDKLTKFVKEPHRGAGGLVYIKYNEDGTIKSSIDKFFDEAALRKVGEALGVENGDLVLILSDKVSKTRSILGDLRLELAHKEGWIDENEWSVFWVVDFPLFERDEESGSLTFAHHPFCMPHPDDFHLIDSEPEKVRAMSYDMVMNGNEICSGSQRIHDRKIQEKIFEILGLSKEEQEEKFGFMLKAFQYGAPPHAGCAFGLDRWVMLMTGEDSIRDVIAFPKTAGGRDLMMDAPSFVPPENLEELGISVIEKAE